MISSTTVEKNEVQKTESKQWNNGNLKDVIVDSAKLIIHKLTLFSEF